MKKILSGLLLCCVLLGLCACGGFVPAASAVSESEYEQELGSAPVLDVPLLLPYTRKNADGDYINLPEAGRGENGNIIYDGSFAKVTVLRCRYSSFEPQYEIDLLIQNRTDKRMSIESAEQAVVDGFTFECYCDAVCEPNALCETTLYIFAYDFARLGIETPQEVKFNLSFYESQSYKYIDTVYEAIYPNEHVRKPLHFLAMEEIGYPELEYYNKETGCNFRIVDAKFIQDGEFYKVDIILENKSNEYRFITWENVTVNGADTEPYWAVGIPSGAKLLSYIYLDMYDLHAKGVEEPDEISFIYTVNNGRDVLLEEALSFRPAKG